ncbi:MAG: hypothetical protein ABJA66_07615 [Actinomycetota bacterium]
MQSKLIKISFGVLIFSFLFSCASVKKLIPKEIRPYQEKKFDSKLWIDGDAQTRGEMAKDLLWKKSPSEGYFLSGKTETEILTILGEPSRKTRGKCCGAGGTSDDEVWLYNIEVEDSSNSKTEIKQFQLYFTPGGKVDETRIELWDDKNPDYFPRIG